jgi:aminomethyltransferase
MVERGIARHGYPVYVGEDRVGVVTSGTRTPFLEKAIGLTYLPRAASAPGAECAIEIRGRRVRARVVPLPFYKRPRG